MNATNSQDAAPRTQWSHLLYAAFLPWILFAIYYAMSPEVFGFALTSTWFIPVVAAIFLIDVLVIFAMRRLLPENTSPTDSQARKSLLDKRLRIQRAAFVPFFVSAIVTWWMGTRGASSPWMWLGLLSAVSVLGITCVFTHACFHCKKILPNLGVDYCPKCSGPISSGTSENRA
jgi:hypothetical protein